MCSVWSFGTGTEHRNEIIIVLRTYYATLRALCEVGPYSSFKKSLWISDCSPAPSKKNKLLNVVFIFVLNGRLGSAPQWPIQEETKNATKLERCLRT